MSSDFCSALLPFKVLAMRMAVYSCPKERKQKIHKAGSQLFL